MEIVLAFEILFKFIGHPVEDLFINSKKAINQSFAVRDSSILSPSKFRSMIYRLLVSALFAAAAGAVKTETESPRPSSPAVDKFDVFPADGQDLRDAVKTWVTRQDGREDPDVEREERREELRGKYGFANCLVQIPYDISNSFVSLF